MSEKNPVHPSRRHEPSHHENAAPFKPCLTCFTHVPLDQTHCPLCHDKVPARKPNSLSNTWAYLLTAIIVFIPANVFPIITTTSLAGSQSDTILSGIFHLWQNEAKFIAMIVFIASFVTPLFKILSIGYLCYSCQFHPKKHRVFRTRLYHFSDSIGRWSMIDVFVVALLGALVQMGVFANIAPQSGILYFTGLVILTMLAVNQFDPRLIWDDNGGGLSHEYE